jgi:pimeloyl-ACP methyl ester carboxylesterase
MSSTITVPHLGTSTIGYKLGREYDASLPTLVMVNSFTTSVEQYRPQFADETLAATANLQVLDALGIPAAFALGTSQGGWIAARMAILAPDTIKGIVPLGTSMDFESPRSRELGCWDGIEFCTPAIDALAEPVGDDWVIPTELVDAVLKEGLGDNVSDDERSFWHSTYQRNYTGDAGRARVRISSINLRDRDGLHGRLDSLRCPVLRMHGTEDPVYSIANAEDEMPLFVNSPSAELRVVEGGQHFLSASNPADVNPATAEFITRWA